MLRKIFLSIIIMFSFVFLISCGEKEVVPYDEDSPTYDMVVKVDSVGDYIEYSYRSGKNEDGSYIYKPIHLRFVGFDYNGYSNETNDYYIIVDKNRQKKLFPKQLMVGELLIFKAFSVQEIGDYIAGKYLEYMMKPNLEIVSVEDTVKYKFTDSRASETEIEYLYFENTDYGNKTSNDNNYYIIDGENRVEPLNLKVGDKLYFDTNSTRYNIDKKTAIPVGGYLYLVNNFVNDIDNS